MLCLAQVLGIASRVHLPCGTPLLIWQAPAEETFRTDTPLYN